MARSPFEPWLRRAAGRAGLVPWLTLLAMACGAAPATLAAGLTGSLQIEKGERYSLSGDGKTQTIHDVVLTHPRSETRVTASLAVLVLNPDGTRDLDLSGAVHIEIRGAVLDAGSATVVFRGDELVSVQVKGSPQATFSHQPRGSSRRINGRADAISYDAASAKVRFTGNGSYAFADGSARGSSDTVIYDTNVGSVEAGPFTGAVQFDNERERVPPPRTPDRESAQ
jgi:lipopolysaccharide export system protein LptA